MSKPMTLERFAALAEAFGGRVSQWPDAERAAAERLMAADPKVAERLLFEARQLDAALMEAPTFPVPNALREAVIAAAPKAGARPGRAAWWVFGAGWATAAVAGVALGLAGAAQLTNDMKVAAAWSEYGPAYEVPELAG